MSGDIGDNRRMKEGLLRPMYGRVEGSPRIKPRQNFASHTISRFSICSEQTMDLPVLGLSFIHQIHIVNKSIHCVKLALGGKTGVLGGAFTSSVDQICL